MIHRMDLEQVQNELVDACAWGEEDRAYELVERLGAEEQARALLETLLQRPEARARQAAALGLGILGGALSVKCLEQRLILDEAWTDSEGKSAVEEIIRSLGRIEDASAGAALVRKLERLTATAEPTPGDVSLVAHSLWRRRYPGLLPAVRDSLDQLEPKARGSLPGLLVLLEKTPDELQAWALDPSVSVEDKAHVVMVLDSDLPSSLIPTLPSFISAATALLEQPSSRPGATSFYCYHLFSLILLYEERILPMLPEESRAELRTLARRVVESADPKCSFEAAIMLESVGLPEDATVIEASRLEDSFSARPFEHIARSLRGPQARP
jgi:hypothetical protein